MMIGEHKNNYPLISVIVPVYNVEEYLDECISSIVNQTYKNLEILLIDDGSTDKSKEICESWGKRDARIVVFSKKNSGQADARNLGVEISKGDLLTFVDADDWISLEMIEKLYVAMSKYDADISMCEAYTENSEGVLSSYSLQHLEIPCINMQEEKEFLLTVRYTLWSKLYKKTLFVENNIKEPSMKFEDFAVVPIIYAFAKKVACVNEPLYYYRYRVGSTIRDVMHIDDRIMALQFLVNEFNRQEKLYEWKSVLYKICTERGLILMRQVYPMLSKRFEKFCSDYDLFLKRSFQIGLSDISRNFYNQCKSGTVNARLLGNYNLAVFGSYNLMIIAKMIMNLGMPDFMERHDSFASLISVVSEPDDCFYEWNLEHKSSYREKHLVQDVTKTFMHKSPCEYKDIDFVLVDFLEERFDVGNINGKYFTLSDAFLEVKDNLVKDYTVLSRCDDHTRTLWKESCRIFVNRLKKYIDSSKIILVRTLLCEKFGEDKESLLPYDNIHEIKKINSTLNEYYDYFMKMCPDAIEVKLDGFNLFTEKNYRHGCYPWHMNAELYWLIHLRVLGEMKQYDSAAVDEVVDKSMARYRS